RTTALKRLHEDMTSLFVNSRGFGNVRMLSPAMEIRVLEKEVPSSTPQPGERDTSAGPLFASLAAVELGLDNLHRNSLLDFLDPTYFGYLESRDRVAGFLPHRFSQTPPAPKRWRLQTLDLVGLLMRDAP